MSFIPKIRMDVALGVLTAGALLYAYRRDISGMVSARSGSGSSNVSGERKRKRDEIETLEALGPIMSDPAYLDITERILLQCDPQTIIRVASTSKYLNDLVTSSLAIQLLLRQYYHKIPPLVRPSEEQRKLLQLSKREQLDHLVDREERLSRFRHTKLQRCEMPYIDVLCSGDYMIITRSLHSKFRIPDVPESGPVEDGFTVMLPDPEARKEDGKPGLEGYRDWTVDVGGEIADIGVRSDEDMIVIATFLDDGGERKSTRTVRIAFYHLEIYEPHHTNPDLAVLVPHAEAKFKTADFELDAEECKTIRLRSGPEGKLLIWAKHEDGCRHARSLVYDWKRGVPIASPWGNDEAQYGLPHDFTFCTPDIILAAVLSTTKPNRKDWTPVPDSDETPTRLEIQVLRLPDTSSLATPPSPSERSDSAGRFSPDRFPPCTHVASFRFPEFTHKWQNPGPSDDEVLPVEGGQTFRLVHSSIAAKPSPGTNGSGEDQGLLCITIEGDFGPITHPDGGVAHDHGCIAFCTIAGSVFNNRIFNMAVGDQPKIINYEDWHRGHIAWEFGPGNTWVTGFGTRTTSVARYMDFIAEGGEDMVVPDPATAKRSTIVAVQLRNYDPVAVLRQGRVSRRPLGRAPSAKEGEGDLPNTGILDGRERVESLQNALIPEEIISLVNFTRRLQHGPNAHPIDDLTDLFSNMVASTGNTFRVVTHSEAKFSEMFSGTTLENTLPFYEANVAIRLDDDEERSEAAMDHPFKTILARDRLIVCDDGGFDVFHY